jgi:hypothetical protein
MTAPAPLRIDAIVTDGERPALVDAEAQLRDCLHAASGSPWPVEVRFRESLAAIDPHDPPAVVVASLLLELDRGGEPLATTQARWQQAIASLPEAPRPAILLCTIFRHVAAPAQGAPDDRVAVRERLRRLNLLVVDLSHDARAGVVDLDRAFSQLGARALATDHRLTGAVAAGIAAHAIVAGILTAGLDDRIPPEIQERATQHQGPLRDAVAFVERRLAARA